MQKFQSHFDDTLSLKEFLKIQRYVKEHLGINLHEGKRVMVETRLRKRLKDLSIFSFKEYCEYLFSKEGGKQEHDLLIDVITTNKTDFFREPHHFDFLTTKIIPELIKKYGTGYKPSLWSAACSKGAEPYTIAIVLEDYRARNPKWSGEYNLLATDISLEILQDAQRAVYSEEEIEPVAKYLRHRYLLKSKDPTKKLVRIAPEVRKKVLFRRLNLMDNFKSTEKMDVIFCRNVLIYFDKATQNQVIEKLLHNLKRGGYLLMGHSETLEVGKFSVENSAPSIYRKL